MSYSKASNREMSYSKASNRARERESAFKRWRIDEFDIARRTEEEEEEEEEEGLQTKPTNTEGKQRRKENHGRKY